MSDHPHDDAHPHEHARWKHDGVTAEAGPGDFIYVPPYVPHGGV